MPSRPITKVLIANRGEIAVRVIRACHEQGVATVAVFSEADAGALHVQLAGEAVCVGPAAAAKSYLDVPALLAAARATGADAVHPGYGFLSENAGFAQAVIDAGLTWIGPSPAVIDQMGSKTRARALMEAAGVPVVPGYNGDVQDVDALVAESAGVGFPLLVKASAGGGGKGMRLVEAPEALPDAIRACQREAAKAFGDDRVFLERYLLRPRHIEFQIFGDAHGHAVHLFERECSVQRRHQKVVEETPSVALTAALRREMGDAAVAAAKAVGYVGAGTVEFILDEDGSFFFLEMNTRLQVEHPVTEEVVGLDLVALQLAVARGEPLPFTQAEVSQRGHAIEVRVYAEDPSQGFVPATGTLLALDEPRGPGIRVDSALFSGMEVSVHYDPMLAKLIAWGPDRGAAIRRLVRAIDDFVALGVTTNLPFLKAVLSHEAFAAGDTTTAFIPTYLPDWAPDAPALTPELVALIAAAELLDGAGGPAHASQGAASPGLPAGADPYSPWDRLGPFRMGGA